MAYTEQNSATLPGLMKKMANLNSVGLAMTERGFKVLF
jgi:hypothetical protein